jgi:phage shock protein PspC (stress-responsive transcriptional regulator)
MTAKKEIKRLKRSKDEKVLAGVCGGIANYLNIDPVVVRVFWIFLLIPGGLPGILPYILCWIIIPKEE